MIFEMEFDHEIINEDSNNQESTSKNKKNKKNILIKKKNPKETIDMKYKNIILNPRFF